MGKIGKPQKSNKHKKIKKTFDSNVDEDLDFQSGGKRRKFGNLPVNEEDLDKQEVPRKLKEIIQSKNAFKTAEAETKGKVSKKKKFRKAAEATFHMERGITKPMQTIPRFVQGKYEKDRNFIRRVELETHRVIMKAQMEEKYNIEIPDTGPVNPVMNPGVVKKTGEKKKEKNKERKKKKLEAKKQKKAEKTMDFSALRDDVKFGEVAMAPPSLTAKPRKAIPDDDKPRPGKRSLLLKDLMQGTDSSTPSLSNQQSDSTSKNRPNPKSQAQRQAGQTVRRKYLSPVQQQITDFQRSKAIDLYRKMKEHKMKKLT